MEWQFLLLAISGCYAVGVSLYLHRQTGRLKFLGLFFAACFFTFVQIVTLAEPVFKASNASFLLHQIILWGYITSLAFIFCSLLIYVRESKPAFSRFPILYVTFPFLIIISYSLVYNTEMLRWWLLILYEGTAAVAAALMYGIKWYQNSIYLTTFIASLLFFITFLLSVIIKSYPLIWRASLIISIITLFSGYILIDQKQTDKIKTS